MSVNLKKNINKSSIKVLASLACFTGGSEALWGQTTYYVTQTAESGTPTDCETCDQSGSPCCTFVDAVVNANAITSGNVIISVPIDVAYNGTIDQSSQNNYGITLPSTTGTVTFQGTGSNGVIDFTHASTAGETPIVFEIFSGAYAILDGVVFQNTGGNAIFIEGSLQINGTTTATGAQTFSDVLWDFGNAGSTAALYFGPITSGAATYADDFAGTITVGAGQPNTTLLVQNKSGGNDVTISGNISFNKGSSVLTIFPSSLGTTLTFSGDMGISGDGTFLQVNINIGAGTVIFTGTNTINTLDLYGSTLSVASVAALGGDSVAINFLGGTLELPTGTVDLPAGIAISVTDSSTLTSLGTTTIAGTITGYDGATFTITGTNEIGNVSVGSNALFTINGAISGTGQTLTKTGAGALKLTGTSSTYTGATSVSAGLLEVDQTITSSSGFTVSSGAFLTGIGTVTNAAISGAIVGGSLTESGSSFSASPGTLTVDGTLALEEGSYFGTIITPGNTSLVHATGNVTIDSGSQVVVAFHPGTYNNTSTVILSSSTSITGEFSEISVNSLAPNFYSGSLSYTGTEVLLGLTERSVVSLATGGNAVQVADGLDGAITYNRTKVSYTISADSSSIDPSALGITIGSGFSLTASPTPELADVLESLISFTTETEMTYALNQLHPAQLKGMAISQENNAVRVRESLSQRMLNDLDADNCEPSNSYHKKNTACCEKEKRMVTTWVGGLGDTLKQNNKNNSYGPLAGYRTNTGGAVAGIDVLFADFFYAGALGAYTHSHLHFQEGKGTGDISSGYGGVYLSVLGPQLFGSGFLGDFFFANASILGSWSQYRADRHIEYTGVNLTAKNNHGGNQLLAHFDTGLSFNWWGLTVRPFDSFDYMTQIERKYHEDNAGEWDLTVQKKNMIMLRNELGLQFAKCFCSCSSKWIVSPKFSWVREVRVKGDSMDVNFTGGGTQFTIHGYFPDRNLFVPGLALTGFMLKDALVFDLYYNGEFTGGYSSNSIGGQVGYSF